MLLVICLWTVSFGYFPRCSAQDLPCTITQDAGQTRYSVPQFKTTNCYYWWTNSTIPRKANCITKCSPSAVLQNGGGISRNHWVTVSFVTILLLLLVVGILLYSFKNSICRDRRIPFLSKHLATQARKTSF